MDSQQHKRDHQTSYQQHLDELKRSSTDRAKSMQMAVGGEFRTMGILERNLLLEYGLPSDGYLIDVGCGSGRLSSQLAETWSGRYLGIDILAELLEHARSVTPRDDWRFKVAAGLTIPEGDGRADMVCFFSVLTHLLHEESYVYLKEASRVLVSGGKIVFSFLEFTIPSHWAVFARDIENVGSHQVLNQFMSRDAIHAWAGRLGLRVEAIHDGDKPHIAIDAPLKFDDGRQIEHMGALGQSVCVLVKP